MASKRRLNIVIDGNAELAPYWPKIVSDYLVKIVRCFCDNPREQGAKNATCELGLVMYNANSDVGYDVQYIQWTKDVEYFLGSLSCLAFNGDHINQYAMAEGLAEALTMYPKDSNGRTMTVQDYYNGERHCIVVAAGVPVPRKMSVTVPRIRQGKLVIGPPFDTFTADFLQVAQLFNPLAISLSVITPEQHAIFGQIFNLGNDITEMTYAPLSNYKVDQFVILLSRNFKEAREALHGKRVQEDSSQKTSLESISTLTDITLDELFNTALQEDLFSVGKTTSIRQQAIQNSYRKRSVEAMKTTDFTDFTLTELFTSGTFQEDLFSAAKATMIADSTIEAAKAAVRPKELRSVASIEPKLLEVMPNGTTDEGHASVSSSSSVSPMNDFEDIIAELSADIDLVVPTKKSKNSFQLELEEDPLSGLFVPAQPSFEEIIKAVEAEFEKALEGGSSTAQNTSRNQTCIIIDLTKDDDKEVQISSQGSAYPKVPSTTSTGIGSSKGLLLEPARGTPAFSLGNSSSSSAFLTNHSSSSGFSLGINNSSSALLPNHNSSGSGFIPQNSSSLWPAASQQQARNGFGNSLFPQANSNSAFQFQPYTSPLLHVNSNNHFGGGSRGNFSSSGSLLWEQNFPAGYQYLQRERSMTSGYDPLHIPHAFGRSASWAPPVPRMPQAIQTGSLLPPPSLMNIRDYAVHTWEGYIGGKLSSGRTSYIRAKGFRRATSPFTLTFQWSGRLEMRLDIPVAAVVHTQSVMRDQIDYVLFHVTQYNNLDFYHFLIRSNKCAKIDLPTQTLILYPTESEFYYVGMVFPWETMFVEPKAEELQ